MTALKNKTIRVILLVLCLVLAFSSTAIAQQSDLNLIINCTDDGKPLPDTRFDIYFVAMTNVNGELSPTEDFVKYPVNIKNADAASLRDASLALSGLVKRDSITPFDSGATDHLGNLSFPFGQRKLEKGLYLVVGEAVEKDNFIVKAEPALVLLPYFDASRGEYVDTATLKPKIEKTEASSSDTSVRVQKIWKNDKGIERPEKITVDLLNGSEVKETVTLNEGNNWQYEWKNLPLRDEKGSVTEWNVVERTVPDYDLSVSKDGKTVTLTNTYAPHENPDGVTTSRSVKKLWEDKGNEDKRPKEITVELLKNGRLYDSAVLSESNDWRHKWDKLDRFDTDGEIITWSLRETPVSGYKSSTELNGFTFVLTNKYDSPKIPTTGVPWQPAILLGSAGILLLLLGILLKKRSKKEK